MKGKILKKVIAAALVLTLVSGGVPIQPLSQVFEDMSITANAETTTSTVNVGGMDYTLFTGFTATDGNGNNWANLVDGNTSTDWMARKSYVTAGDFNGGTEDPAYVEFHADEPIIPKGYVLTCDHQDAGFWKPVQWSLKAKLNEGDAWTTIHSSNTTLGAGKAFEIPCSNDGNNKYQYFRFEVYEVGATNIVDLDELQFYGSLPAYTHLTVKAATCTATGIKVDCYLRNSDGKYFTDETGATELAESDVIAPMIPHSGEHHEATDVNIEYWQCSMCGKYFSDEGYTTEITEEQTKIYRTITIDGSISSLVTSDVSQALAGETVYLDISDLIDAPTLKVNNGAVELTATTDIQYKFTMPAADVTVTADVLQSNADGDVLTGSIKHTVIIPDGASITLNDAAISGSIVCEGSATITLVGTNSTTGKYGKAGIQIGGSGTTLTIRGDGSLTANGGSRSAGIGLSSVWNVTEDVIGGDIIIEGGTITATGGYWGSGIGIGTVKNTNNDNSTSVQFGNVTIKGGTVTATGGDSGDGIGKGYSYSGPAITFGTVTIYDDIDKVDASSIKNSGSIVYKHEENDVTASTSDYFTIIENGNRRIIVQKVTPTIADVPDQTYTGSAITPEPLVQTGSLSLTKGTDYEYSYTNNTNVGTAKVTVTFKGDYASLGYVEKEFTILPSTVIVNVTGNGTVTYNGKSAASGETFGVAAEKGTDVTLTLAPESGYAVSIEYGYTNNSGMTASGFKLPVSGTTATLTVPNDLKDGTYVNLTVTFAPALNGGADEASAVALTDNTVTDLAGGWYKVDSDITFDHTLNLLGDTHLIIADGKTMTVNTATDRGILSDYTLFVRGDGALSVTTTADYGIAVRVGNYVQTGATVTASGYIGIRCTDDFIAFNFDNDFTFSGGQLTATGNGGDGIWANGNTTLGYTNATDYIHSSSYSIGSGCTIAVASGQVLTDGTNFYSGTLTITEIKSLAGKTLVRAYAVNLPESTTGGTVSADKEYVAANADDKTVTLTVTPDEGYVVKSVSVNNGAVDVIKYGSGEGIYTFTMPDGDVTVSAEFEQIIYTLVSAKTATCTEDGNIEYYQGSDGKLYLLTDGVYTEISAEDTVIKATGHTYGEPVWTWAEDHSSASAKFTCVKGDDEQTVNAVVTSETIAPTYEADGKIVYTAKATINGTEYTDTKEVAIPKKVLVATVGDEKYDSLKAAVDAAGGDEVVVVYADVNEPDIDLGYDTTYGSYYKDIEIDLNGHTVTVGTIATGYSLTLKNGTLNCAINNVSNYNATLTLDNAVLNTPEPEDEYSQGISWNAAHVEVKNGSTLVLKGNAYFGGWYDSFVLNIDETSSVVMNNVMLSGSDKETVIAQFSNYLPDGYSFSYDDNEYVYKIVNDYGVIVTTPVILTYRGYHRITLNFDSWYGMVTADKSSALVDDTITLTVNPDEHYQVKSVTVNGGVVAVTSNNDGTYSFTMPDGDVTVSAEFELQKHTVNISSENCQIIVRKISDNDSYGVVVHNGDKIEYGTKLIYDVTADYGYYLGNDGSAIYTTKTYETTVDGDTTITAKGYAKNYRLSLYTYGGGGSPVIVGEHDYAPYNTYITIRAGEPNEGYEFVGWYQTNGKFLSSDEEYKVKMTSGMSIRAQYRKTSGVVIFMANDQIQSEFADADYTDYYNSFIPSAKYGYEFTGWDKTVDEINTALASGNVTVKANFAPKKETFNVTINNGEVNADETVSCTESTLITRTAKAVEGKTFAYWLKDGALFTYNPKISFTANAECVITAVYTDNSVTEQITAEVNKVSYVDGNLIIKAGMSVPDGMEIVSVGIKTSSNSDMSEAIETTATTSNNPAEFAVTKTGVTANTTLYAQAYVTYTDGVTTTTAESSVMMITAGQDYDAAEKGTATIRSATYNADTKKATFNAYLTVPENAVIVKAGLVAAPSTKFDPTSAVLTDDNADYVKSLSCAEGKCAPVNYTWNKSNVNKGDTWYARAYLVYTLNNEQHIVYGSLVEFTA